MPMLLPRYLKKLIFLYIECHKTSKIASEKIFLKLKKENCSLIMSGMKKMLFSLLLSSLLTLRIYPMDLEGVEVVYAAPKAEEFVALRAVAGMRERKIASAEKGLPNSLFWVTLRIQDKLIGMGRVVGDGGTVAQITDIAVHPDYRRRGYGRFIFEEIERYILEEIPDDAFVCLFAEKEIAHFYEGRGFVFAQEKWPGMFWPCAERAKLKEKITIPGQSQNVPRDGEGRGNGG
jgi:GNAT superfamily N-acetyltransferase